MRDWNEPRKDLVREQDPQVGKHKSKKNRKKWCRGKEGVEHQPGKPVLSKWYESRKQWSLGRKREPLPPCRWVQSYRWQYDEDMKKKRPVGRNDWHWSCSHQIHCDNCGKVLEHWLTPQKSCPDYDASTRPS